MKIEVKDVSPKDTKLRHIGIGECFMYPRDDNVYIRSEEYDHPSGKHSFSSSVVKTTNLGTGTIDVANPDVEVIKVKGVVYIERMVERD